MTITDNFNLFNLFLDKRVKISVDKQSFYIRVPTIREFCIEEKINAVYHIWNLPVDKLKKFTIMPCASSYELTCTIIFELGAYREYKDILASFKEALGFIFPTLQIDMTNKKLIVNDVTITEEIWEYVLYVLRLSCGEKVEKPRTFASEDERQFYLAQKKMEEKIKKIKAQAPGDSEGLLNSFLSIQYAFNLSFEYLAEQTMAQIHWLQKHAAGAVSYEVNAKAFAAGNMKKGKKLDFFIK